MATIGSATRSSEEMAKLVKCGISIARFNLTFQTEVGRQSVWGSTRVGEATCQTGEGAKC